MSTSARDRAPVTVLGLGPMGSAMAAAFLAKGHPTTVWNRTASKAAPLVEMGATQAATPADALAASELVVVSQTDYPAMYGSLGAAADALKGRVLVNLSSGSPGELRKAGEWAAEHGAELLTGGIMVPPPGVGQPGAYVFYSGSKSTVERHRATLEALGDIAYVGDDLGLAMLYYQAQLFVFWSTLTSYMYSAALLESAGVRPEELRPYATRLIRELADEGPMGYVKILTAEIQERRYPGDENSLHMQAVGTRHVVDAFRDAGLDTGYADALRAVFDRAVETGHGADGLSSIFETVRKD
jgi:3-hydroxyisobutyrate dehydrogenase-like beta-hydroxyacid dehydrogenase